MASSPPSTVLPRPSFPSKKRPSLGSPHGSNAKRRKPSTGPSALRQTSFPPDESALDAITGRSTRSPSVESSVLGGGGAGSIATSRASGAGGKRKRAGTVSGSVKSAGRGGKAGSVKGAATMTATSVGGRDGGGASVKGGQSGAGGGGDEDGGEDEDEDDGGGEDAVMEGGGKMDEAAAKQEREHLSMLVDALDRDQAQRYDVWRRIRLKKETVRRITNQTLSQSVPASVVTTINGYTKIFIGEIIDRAREVQAEWLASSSSSGLLPLSGEKVTTETTLADRTMEMDKGPLEPDHLREALRRYKMDREGGGAGFEGLSLQGKLATASRTRGRRLFR